MGFKSRPLVTQQSSNSQFNAAAESNEDCKAEHPLESTTESKDVVIDAPTYGSTNAKRLHASKIPSMKQNNKYSKSFRTLSINVYDSQRFPSEKASKNKITPSDKFTWHSLVTSLSSLFRSTPKGTNQKDVDYFASLDFHSIGAEELCQRLSVSPTVGLDNEAVRRRIDRNGKNVFAPAKRHYWKKILRYLFGDFCSILWIGVIVFMISWRPLGDPPQAYNLALAIVVLIVILVQASFSAFQDWSTQKVMNSIMSFLPGEAFILRDGSLASIPASDLVVGDIVHLTMGQKVPADMRIIDASADLKFDRSFLTGESEEVSGSVESKGKNFMEAYNVALLGTHVCHGTARCVVVLTGDRTVMGRINKYTNSSTDTEQTNLQREIVRFVKIIIALTVSLVLIMLIVWLAWLRVDHYDFLPVTSILTDLMSLVVAFIPEGVPIAVAFTLLIAAKRMRNAQILPKSLSTVETLGCVDVICSDKTGTLTQNLMEVTSIAFADGELSLDNVASGALDDSKGIKEIKRAMIVCNDAFFDASELPDDEGQKKEELNAVKSKTHGNATDGALLRFTSRFSDFSNIKSEWKRVFSIPFNSTNKYMLTMDIPIKSTTEDEYIYYVTLKGAPDVLLPRCTKYLPTNSNEEALLDDSIRNGLINRQKVWSSQGLRVIMLARRSLNNSQELQEAEHENFAITASQDELCIVGIIGIVDPPREDIPSTVSSCRRAGARFFMVTGDFSLTAVAIARQCGILTSQTLPSGISDIRDKPKDNEASDTYIQGGLLVEGSEISGLSKNIWDIVCRYEEVIFARTSPEHKMTIVTNLRDRGHVVAVTGAAHSMFFFYMYTAAGIPPKGMFFAFAKYSQDGYYGHSLNDLNKFLSTGQCVYFVTLVILQVGNLFSVRNKRLSILQANPIQIAHRNLWIFLGPLISITIAIIVTEGPGIQSLFNTASVPIKFWLIPIPLALGILVVDEVRKILARARPHGFIARISW